MLQDNIVMTITVGEHLVEVERKPKRKRTRPHSGGDYNFVVRQYLFSGRNPVEVATVHDRQHVKAVAQLAAVALCDSSSVGF